MFIYSVLSLSHSLALSRTLSLSVPRDFKHTQDRLTRTITWLSKLCLFIQNEWGRKFAVIFTTLKLVHTLVLITFYKDSRFVSTYLDFRF